MCQARWQLATRDRAVTPARDVLIAELDARSRSCCGRATRSVYGLTARHDQLPSATGANVFVRADRVGFGWVRRQLSERLRYQRGRPDADRRRDVPGRLHRDAHVLHAVFSRRGRDLPLHDHRLGRAGMAQWMLNRLLSIAFAGCVAAPISEVNAETDVPQALVDTDFTGGAACLNGPLVTPVFCTVDDVSSSLFDCEPAIGGLPCWSAVVDAECASGFEIVITSELPIATSATSATYEATCWSR
jgi:hypothetical protein